MKIKHHSDSFPTVIVLLILNILSAAGRLVYESSLTEQSTFFITFYFFELLYYIVAIVFGFVRKDKQYDLPVFHEMSSTTYWYSVLIINTFFKMPFISKFIEIPSSFLLIYLGMMFFVFHGFIRSYQMDVYNSDHYHCYKNRLQELLAEAKITPEELSLVKEDLLKRAVAKQKTPFAWKVVLFSIAITLGSVIGAAASELFDGLVGLGVDLPGVIWPK